MCALYRVEIDNFSALKPVKPTPLEFVGVLCDVLRLEKILVVARHFHRFPLLPSNTDLRIDVWVDNALSSWEDITGTMSALLHLSHIFTGKL